MLVRLLITDVLREEWHFKVIEAKNATEALRVLEARPDVRVLFTDAEMPPGPTGFELAREVCERFPYVQIIISSGRMRPGADEMPTALSSSKCPGRARPLFSMSKKRQVEPGSRRVHDLALPAYDSAADD